MARMTMKRKFYDFEHDNVISHADNINSVLVGFLNNAFDDTSDKTQTISLGDLEGLADKAGDDVEAYGGYIKLSQAEKDEHELKCLRVEQETVKMKIEQTKTEKDIVVQKNIEKKLSCDITSKSLALLKSQNEDKKLDLEKTKIEKNHEHAKTKLANEALKITNQSDNAMRLFNEKCSASKRSQEVQDKANDTALYWQYAKASMGCALAIFVYALYSLDEG